MIFSVKKLHQGLVNTEEPQIKVKEKKSKKNGMV